MAKKFSFYFNGERKVSKVPNSLFKLMKANELLVDDDDYEYDCELNATPFNVTYDWLAQRCYEIAVGLFNLNVENTWVEFVHLSEKDKAERIACAVNVCEI